MNVRQLIEALEGVEDKEQLVTLETGESVVALRTLWQDARGVTLSNKHAPD